MLAHSSERENSDPVGDASKVVTQNGSIVFMRSILRAEKYVDLTTAEHKSSTKCESRNNHRYAVVVQSSRHLVESVSNQNFTGDGEEFTKVPEAVAEDKSLVKNVLGIIRQLHSIDQRQAELQKELYVEQKKSVGYSYRPEIFLPI